MSWYNVLTTRKGVCGHQFGWRQRPSEILKVLRTTRKGKWCPRCGTPSGRINSRYWQKLGVVHVDVVRAGVVALARYAVSGRFSFLHLPHGSICCVHSA
jgi:hypothetical protein